MSSITTTIGAFKAALKSVVTATGAKVANIVIDKDGLHVEAATTEGFASSKVKFDQHTAKPCSAAITQAMIGSILGNEASATILTLNKTDAGIRLRFAGASLQMKKAEVEPSEMFNQSYHDMARVMVAVSTGGELKEALIGSVRHMATRDVRYYLCGVHVKVVEGELFFSGTNGFALHQKASGIKVAEAAGNINLIMPANAAHAATTVFENDEVVQIHKVGTNLIGFSTADFYWVSNLIAGTFPETTGLLGKEAAMKAMKAGEFIIPKRDLLTAITRITAMSEKDGRYCRMSFNEAGLVVNSVDGEQVQKIDLNVIHNGLKKGSEAENLHVSVTSAVFYESLDSVPSEHVYMVRDEDSQFPFFIRPVTMTADGHEISTTWVAMILPAKV